MLRLLKDGRRGSSRTTGRLPENILLSDRLMTFGRSYKTDIKLMLPFISRKHMTLTRIDGHHFLEAMPNSVVFVNDVRVQFKVLADGCTITLGGVRKTFPEGSRLPSALGSHVVYTYSVVRDALSFGLYEEPIFSSDQLIKLDDFVGGRLVTEVYHTEDFNCTLDDDSFCDINETLHTPSQLLSSTDVAATASSNTVAPSQPSDLEIIQDSSAERTMTSSAIKSAINTFTQVNDEPVIEPALAANSSCARQSYQRAISLDNDSDSSDGGLRQYGVRCSLDYGANYYDSSDSDSSYRSGWFGFGGRASEPSLKGIGKSKKQKTKTELWPGVPEKKSKKTASGEKSRAAGGDDFRLFLRPVSPLKEIGNDNSLKSFAIDIDDMPLVTRSPLKRKHLPDDKDDDAVTGLRSSGRRKSKQSVRYFGAGCHDDSSDEDYENQSCSTKTRRTLSAVRGKAIKERKSTSTCISDRTASLWAVPLEARPKPHLVHLVTSYFKYETVDFSDKEVFKVVNRDGDEMMFRTANYSVDVDVALLQYHLKMGLLSSADISRFVALVHLTADIDYAFDMKKFELASVPELPYQLSQPKNVNILLKPYQLASLGWMTYVERHTTSDWFLPRLSQLQLPDSNLLLDIMHRLIVVPPVPRCGDVANFRVRVKGGILADEMGLGKTITMIAMFVNNSADDIPRIPSYNSVLEGSLLECRTNLIIAPSHLIRQWQDEIVSHSPTLRVLVITTKHQHEKVSYLDVLEADVVIVSVQYILTNKYFTTMATGNASLMNLYLLARRPGQSLLQQRSPSLYHFLWWRVVCDEAHEIIKYDFPAPMCRAPGPSQGLQTVLGFQSRYRWYVTGTPFPHGYSSLCGALMFIEFNMVSEPQLMSADGSMHKFFSSICDEPPEELTPRPKSNSKRAGVVKAEPQINPKTYCSHVVNFVHQKLFIRNTKDSVVSEFDVPEYVEELMLLTLSDVERGMYDNCTSELERRQLCCHLQVVERLQRVMGPEMLTLNDAKDAMIDHTNQEIKSINTKIKESENDLKKIDEEFRDESVHWKRVKLETRRDSIKKYIADFQTQLKQKMSAVAYFESLASRQTASNTDNSCIICLEDITRMTLTPCGHIFCFDCIRPCVIAKNSCPTCRQEVSVSQLVEVKDSKPGSDEDKNKSEELKQLTEKFGTKMSYLIFYLRYLFIDNPKSRVIIFSQWDKMLNMIGQTLEANGISNVFIKGNIFVRTRAISTFKKEQHARVIMLSLENAASGTNLTEATHIILIDPVAGTEAEALAVEQQAIGRAHRMGQTKQLTVVRMIMRNTIEQQLYERNNKRDVAEVALNITSNSSHHGIEIVRTHRKIEAKPQASEPSTSVTDSSQPSTSSAAPLYC